MNVTLRQLRVFQAVVAAGGFSRAGAELGLTQPAVSRCIHELEGQLGLRLFDRTTRDVAPTDAGRGLAARLDRLLDELDGVLLDVQSLARGAHGTVRIASSPTLSAGLLPACIAECGRRHPGIRLRLLDRIQQDVLTSVHSGEVDFGVVIDPLETAELHAEPIFHDPFVLVCRAEHRWVRLKTVHWRELADQPLVLLDHASGSRRLIDQALTQHGAQARVVQEVGHTTTALRMVEAGLGATVLPALAWPAETSTALARRPLAPVIERAVTLVHRRNRALNPAAAAIWALVRELCTNTGFPP